MITIKQEEKLINRIKGLSELELDSLLKEIGDHLHKNKLEHLIDNAFQMDNLKDEIQNLTEEVGGLEQEKEGLEYEMRQLKTKIQKAIEILQ